MEMNAVEMDKVERHGQSVKRVRSICDMHRVPFGAEENLEDLITALKHNRHFAMDFWALVGELSARENGSLDDEEMLEVIVEGVAGLSVVLLPEQEGSTTRELRQLLAGVDTGLPVSLPDPIERPADALISGGRPGARRSARVVSLPERTRRPETGGATRAGASAMRSENIETMVARRTIGEALSRLEQTSMELREQLAAIEEQIETLPDVSLPDVSVPDVEGPPKAGEAVEAKLAETKEESAEEELPHRQSPSVWRQEPRAIRTPEAAVATVARNGKGEAANTRLPWPEEMEEPVIVTRQPARTVSHRGFAPADEDDDPSIVVPLAAYAAEEENERSTGRRIAVAALLLVLLAGGGYAATHVTAVRDAWERSRPSLQAAYAGFVERLQVLKREATTKSSDAKTSDAVGSGQSAENHQAVPPAPSSSNSGAAAPEAAASTVAASTAAASTTAAAGGGSGLDAKSASAPPQASDGAAGSPRDDAAAGLEPKARTDRESTAVRARKDSADEDVAEPEIVTAGAMRVPQAAMEGNLVASRVPAYPQTAKAEGIEGPVVMEAVISKAGTVDRVRVIEGDRHLRSAAEEAVMRWRYRPYVVNGRPVEVATTIRVDFRLPRRYGR